MIDSAINLIQTSSALDNPLIVIEIGEKLPNVIIKPMGVDNIINNLITQQPSYVAEIDNYSEFGCSNDWTIGALMASYIETDRALFRTADNMSQIIFNTDTKFIMNWHIQHTCSVA